MTNGFEDNPISDKFLLQISQEKSFETNIALAINNATQCDGYFY